MAPMFGYGSLILPTSLISRFESFDTTIGDIYQGKTDRRIRTDAIAKWEQRRDRITYIPARLQGFRRYYSLESERGETMLEVVQTNNREDWINGVLIFGLSEEEEAKISESEAVYDYKTITDPTLDYYIDPDQITNVDLSSVDAVKIFAKDADVREISAEKPRNQTYHKRICIGILMIGEMYGGDVAREFYDDFCETTYETAYDSADPSKFNTVAENNGLQSDTDGQFYCDLQDDIQF